MPGPRPPHRGMADPHGASKAKPKGPPRDVTPSGEVKEETLDELKVSVPVEWEKGHPRSTMRLAEFTLPGPGGDAELVVYRFEGGAGDVEANIERWKGQFEPPEGKSMDELTKVEKRTHAELEITVMDVSGRYVAAVRPGAAAQHDEADYRMLTAIVEGSGDPFFFKAVGPKKTLDVWAEAYETMLASMKTG